MNEMDLTKPVLDLPYFRAYPAEEVDHDGVTYLVRVEGMKRPDGTWAYYKAPVTVFDAGDNGDPFVDPATLEQLAALERVRKSPRLRQYEYELMMDLAAMEGDGHWEWVNWELVSKLVETAKELRDEMAFEMDEYHKMLDAVKAELATFDAATWSYHELEDLLALLHRVKAH